VSKNPTVARPLFEEEIPLNFPLLATVSKIVSYDLQEIHTIGINHHHYHHNYHHHYYHYYVSLGKVVPYARITCDDYDESTSKKWIVRDDTATWKDLNWEIRIINTSVFTIIIMSGSDPIGVTSVTGLDIINWPQKDSNIEMQRIIYNEDSRPTGYYHHHYHHNSNYHHHHHHHYYYHYYYYCHTKGEYKYL